MHMLRLRRPKRLFAALVALGYAWLSAVLCFQHRDFPTHELEALLRVASSSINAQTHAPVQTRMKAQALPIHSAHCVACEWQAANVSPALPAFVVAFRPPSTPRAITTFPRCLSLPLPALSSRGPPLV